MFWYLRCERRNQVARNEEGWHIEQVNEDFISKNISVKIISNSEDIADLSESVDLRYWYPDDPPVPSWLLPSILWTSITWLSGNISIIFDVKLFELTSPLGDQRVNVHERHQQLVWLVKSWLLTWREIFLTFCEIFFNNSPVADDHESSQQSFVSESSLTSPDQSSVNLWIKDGLKLFFLLPIVAHQVSFLGRILLTFNLIKSLLHDAVHCFFIFCSKIKIVRQSRSSLQPSLDK